jgi:CheY-like chemotaxis protein
VLHPLEVAPKPAENMTILIADDESSFRSFLALKLRDSVADVEIIEASDGAEAVQLGLQQHPLIALLDVSMPRLGGVDAALTLRSLRPTMEIALQSGDAEEYRVRATDLGLSLFGKRDLEQPLAWVKARARELITRENGSPPTEKRLAFDRPA